eukprot:3203898-Rhodomonas_salina.1
MGAVFGPGWRVVDNSDTHCVASNGRDGERKARRLSHPQPHALSTAMKERSTISVQPQVAGYGEGVR